MSHMDAMGHGCSMSHMDAMGHGCSMSHINSKPHGFVIPCREMDTFAHSAHSICAIIFFLRSGLTLMDPGALCLMRLDSLRLSASVTARRIFWACMHACMHIHSVE